MLKFNAVQKNDVKQKVVEHFGPSASTNNSSASTNNSSASTNNSSASCTNNNDVLSSTSMCIPLASLWTVTTVTEFAAGAKCVGNTIPALRREKIGNVTVNKYKCT
jgi:hypothetical protein